MHKGEKSLKKNIHTEADLVFKKSLRNECVNPNEFEFY